MAPPNRDSAAEHLPVPEHVEPERPVTMTMELPAAVLEGIDEDSGADGEAVIRWLETGEGDPWPAS
jgi:hypothetical protein